MPESAEPQNDISLEASVPEGTAPLESIVCTEELHRRPRRPPDFEKENRALVALATALSDSASTIFQTLAETILEVTQCDSSGLSLLTPDGGERFYWLAIAGMWAPHAGGGTPRNFSPCGEVLDRNCTILFRHFERRYSYLVPVVPAAEECLLVPFHADGKAVGTIWGIMHSDRRKFDSEDERIMSLTRPICFRGVSNGCIHRRPEGPSRGARKGRSRLAGTGYGAGSQDPAPARRESYGDLHLGS